MGDARTVRAVNALTVGWAGRALRQSEETVFSAAGQTVTAAFGALGYRSAAGTAIGVTAAGVPASTARRVRAEFIGPIGFLTVHRTSRLVLNAGWVDARLPEEDGDGWDESDDGADGTA
ncbi:hypothetical protein [Actinacidiphila glaucinigra]|uniref:hypothetical protein n=1 Tax=Actinacidiphila glaucinigra TaxID=235986 RepID=UPI002E31FD2C|nr:hypothetical protein [Actinacidiphila glaucinigra]